MIYSPLSELNEGDVAAIDLQRQVILTTYSMTCGPLQVGLTHLRILPVLPNLYFFLVGAPNQPQAPVQHLVHLQSAPSHTYDHHKLKHVLGVVHVVVRISKPDHWQEVLQQL